MKLEDLTHGAVVVGVLAGQPVTVVQLQWHGTAAATLTYRTDSQLLYRSDEPRLTIQAPGKV